MFLSNPKILFEHNNVEAFVQIYAEVSVSASLDLNAEINDLYDSDENFDHKASLKSPVWCRSMVQKIKASYEKDVRRKKVKPMNELLLFG